MRIVGSAPAAQAAAAPARARGVAAAVKRWWRAYARWRREQDAMAQLGALSDYELRDIGLARSQIEFAVRGEIEHSRVRPRRLID